MGGVGSGNHWRIGRDTCESYKRIEMSYLRKNGLLAVGYSGSLSWKRGGEPWGDIRFRVHEVSMVLMYRYRQAGETEWYDVSERVPFTFTSQNLGGTRRWFVCLSCGQRCSVLYGGTHYRCRKCHNLAYASQHEAPHQRALSQAQKLRRKLGGSECTDDPFPEKPKGMHWRTFERLRKRGEALDERAEDLTMTMFWRLIKS